MSLEQFAKGLKRMHAADGSFMYANEDGTLKFLMREVSEGASHKRMYFEIVVVIDPDDERLARVMELEHDGWMDDDDDSAFVIDDFEVTIDDLGDADLREMFDLFDKTKRYKICHCGKYLIKDGGCMCFHCELTATEEGLRPEECPICLDAGIMMHMRTTPCCNKMVHGGCLDAWTARGKTGCPFCRTACPVGEDRAVRDIVVRIVNEAVRQAAGDDMVDDDP